MAFWTQPHDWGHSHKNALMGKTGMQFLHTDNFQGMKNSDVSSLILFIPGDGRWRGWSRIFHLLEKQEYPRPDRNGINDKSLSKVSVVFWWLKLNLNTCFSAVRGCSLSKDILILENMIGGEIKRLCLMNLLVRWLALNTAKIFVLNAKFHRMFRGKIKMPAFKALLPAWV